MKKAKRRGAPPATDAHAAGTDEPVLDATEKVLLAEALRRGEETRDAIEDSLLSFGRWALLHIFGDDAVQALERSRANPVWRELVRRAGGPTLRLNSRMLSVALHIAAYDRRIPDEAWRTLDIGRKELLLPLGDEGRMREAAQRTAAFKLTHRATRDMVGAMLEEDGKARSVRLTGPRLRVRVRKLREAIDGKAFVKKVGRLAKEMDSTSRRQVLRELEALRDAAETLLSKLERKRA